MSFRVLVVDDDANLRRMLRAVIEEEGYEVQEASDGDEAIRVWPSVDPDVVLLDIVMPKGPDGLSVLERIRSLAPELIVVMMSGKATLSDAVETSNGSSDLPDRCSAISSQMLASSSTTSTLRRP